MCETKKCSKCKETKPVSEFNRAGGNRPGWQGFCIPCNKAYNREHYLKNREVVLERHASYRKEHVEEIQEWQAKYAIEHKNDIASYHREYRELNRELLRSKTSEWEKNNKEKIYAANAARKAANPEKSRARSIVSNAVAKGFLPKPDACTICSSTESLEYHHEDYSKPLEVIPLCHACHMRLHAGQFALI